MNCPVCKAWVQVKETRQRPDNTMYQRVECANGHRFVTEERVVRVIKPKGKHEGHVALQEDRANVSTRAGRHQDA
jgi:transcriptional regulator NrdR family protein